MSENDKKENLESKEKTPVEESTSEEVAAESKEDTSVEENAPSEEVATESKEESKDKNNNDDVIGLPFIIGIKLGMTQIFANDGTSYPVTVVKAGPCTVTQIKSLEVDGYDSVQLGFLDKKEIKTTKPLLGHFKKSSSKPKKYLKEFRLNSKINGIEPGSLVKLNDFNVGDFLSVTGYSKGKGFAGHMKRHNFSGGRASHGKNSVMRKAGSIGAGTSPGKVWKGTRMAGRMGNNKVTIKNLELIKVDNNDNLLFVSGSIPGANNKIVYINK